MYVNLQIKVNQLAIVVIRKGKWYSMYISIQRQWNWNISITWNLNNLALFKKIKKKLQILKKLRQISERHYFKDKINFVQL